MNTSPPSPSDRLRELIRDHAESLDERPTRTALPLVHPFPAPMSPSLAAALIQAVTVPGDTVLDPMAGSGIVPAAALALGRSCLAMDIDPLARMLVRVQCGRHDVSSLQAAGERVLRRARELLSSPAVMDQRYSAAYDADTRSFIDSWFPEHSRRGLFALWEAIRTATPKGARLPLKIAFSRVIIAKTAGASVAIDLPHTRPHRALAKEVPDPLDMYPRRLRELASRMRARPLPLNGTTLKLLAGDVRAIPVPDSTADFVLTSSPYANAIDYIRSHKFSLVWMGFTLSALKAIRSKMIGTEHGLRESQCNLAWIEEHLSQVSPSARRRVAIHRRFFHDMDTVIGEFYRVLRPGGACAIILGQSSVAGQLVDTPRIVARIAEGRGFTHIGTAYRRINSHRRSLPFGRLGGNQRSLDKRMKDEAIVALGR